MNASGKQVFIGCFFVEPLREKMGEKEAGMCGNGAGLGKKEKFGKINWLQ